MTGELVVTFEVTEINEGRPVDRDHYVARFDQWRQNVERECGHPYTMVVMNEPAFNDVDKFWFISATMNPA